MNIVIIEDEIKTATNLKATLIKVDPSINVITLLDSIESAVAYFKQSNSIDLIFMDIQLADGLSFEIFKQVAIPCPVIFCTAFDEYAIEAFKANGVGYILKPFDDRSIIESLNKVKRLESHFSSSNQLLKNLSELLSKPKTYKTGFLVPYKEKMIPLPTLEIAAFYIYNDQNFIITLENQKYPVNYSLDELEQQLDPVQFYRANRQFIINYKAIDQAEHYFARKLVVKLKVNVPEQIVISKAKASEFLRWMEER